MTDDRIVVPTEDVVGLLECYEGMVHTFMSTGLALLGADWSLRTVERTMAQDGARVELAGDMAAGMGHALVLLVDGDPPVFLATKAPAVEAWVAAWNGVEA